MFSAVAIGLLVGLSLAAPPGPMNALIAKEASRHGWRTGIVVGIGAPVADVLWLVAMVAGIGRLFEGEGTLRVAAACGSVVMTIFAYSAWEQRKPKAAERPATFAAGFIVALTNPYQAAWWLSGGFVLVQNQGPWVIPGFLAGIFGWVVIFAFLVAHGAQRWTWFAPAIRWLSVGLLAYFAVLLATIAMKIISL